MKKEPKAIERFRLIATAVLGIGAGICTAATAGLLAIRPGKPKDAALARLGSDLFAHRGLFDPEEGIPENSIAAFEAAASSGYGIELDVHLTSDGVPIVFHDDDLMRMCGVDKPVGECSYDEIRDLFLADTDMRIPTLQQVLETVDGRVPICVEIKSTSSPEPITYKTAQLLKNYKGPFVVVSFNPLVLRDLKRDHPEFVRGQLVTNFMKNAKRLPFLEKLGLNNMLFDCVGRPHFFSFDVDDLFNPAVKLVRDLYPRSAMVWVVKSQEELDVLQGEFSLLVFEGFRPTKNTA